MKVTKCPVDRGGSFKSTIDVIHTHSQQKCGSENRNSHFLFNARPIMTGLSLIKLLQNIQQFVLPVITLSNRRPVGIFPAANIWSKVRQPFHIFILTVG